MEFDFDEDRSPVINLLQDIAREESTLKRLRMVETVCSALPVDIAKKMQASRFRKHIGDNYLHNHKFIRRLKLISRLESHPETAIELAGEDFITHPEFAYNEEFHGKIAQLDSLISDFTGKCMKNLSGASEVEI